MTTKRDPNSHADERAALKGLFDAERSLREHEHVLLSGDPELVTTLLAEGVAEAKRLADRKEAVLRLERLADLCAQLEGPRMTDALIDILDDEAQSVRVQAAEALVDVGFDRYAELAHGVERTLERGTQTLALQELPWVVCEIAEPSARALIARFLKHPEVEVVASAVEALAELGDPAAVKDLSPLREDSRPVELDDDGDETSATLGELVEEVLDALSQTG